MDIQILDHFPLSIKAQLKRQIIAMINDRRLEPGQPLLSAKQMGLFLNINRNTVAAAYKELESQGYVRVIKGSGTYVGDLPDQGAADCFNRNVHFLKPVLNGVATRLRRGERWTPASRRSPEVFSPWPPPPTSAILSSLWLLPDPPK